MTRAPANETPAEPTEQGVSRAERLFYVALVLTLAIKVAIAVTLPITSDEAYYIGWGRHLALGYYDHPPMIGWILDLLRHFGSGILIMRLPAVLWSTVVGLGIYWLLRPYDRSRAALVATLFVIWPISILGVLVTTDIPLIVFSFFSAAFLFRAVTRERAAYYVWSGIFLGLAFLSKYFAVLLGAAYVAYFLLFMPRGTPARGRHLLLLLGSALPFGLVNLYWNYTHCWDNILFNVINRNEGAHLSVKSFLTYLAIVVYLATPPVLFYLFRHRRELVVRLQRSGLALFAVLFAVPSLIFGLLATSVDIGLHWPLSFYPFLFVLLFGVLTLSELRRTARFMVVFSALHVGAVAVALALPLRDWQFSKHYDSIVFVERNARLQSAIRPYEGQYQLATDRYSTSSLMSYLSGKRFFVFGGGSYHGRQDDIDTDFRRFNGKNILVLQKTAPGPRDYTPFFRSLTIQRIVIDATDFYLVLGQDFNYANYRAQVLAPIYRAYYRIPWFLPHSACYMEKRYFPGRSGAGAHG